MFKSKETQYILIYVLYKIEDNAEKGLSACVCCLSNDVVKL